MAAASWSPSAATPWRPWRRCAVRSCKTCRSPAGGSSSDRREGPLMLIAILSDIHDNLPKLRAAIDHIQRVDALLCGGDLCSPFIVDELARYPGPVHVVFGNNDADLFRIT